MPENEPVFADYLADEFSIEQAWERRRKSLLMVRDVFEITGDTSKVDKTLDPLSRAISNVEFIMSYIDPIMCQFYEESGISPDSISIQVTKNSHPIFYHRESIKYVYDSGCNAYTDISNSDLFQGVWNNGPHPWHYQDVTYGLKRIGDLSKDDILRSFGAIIPKPKKEIRFFPKIFKGK